ncbi:hypothetical protein AWM68_15065 [Fictibacillus phosphorivorans]|uniref:Uncharacterized protein n=1 Tax=Fictibacillus phosphorivorans TaxID=1221500 RepID=A0A163PCR5_9BACL|nr:hypothetical protein [Fictibacillus phosphorivorans]KZE63339.1 hypothetical protein AWM68_15065 [Fictibacillus phosphorivorans]
MSKKKKVFYVIGLSALLMVSALPLINIQTGTNEAEIIKPEAVMASSLYPLMDKDWAVNYHVKKKRIYIENIIPRFSFQGSHTKTPGNQDGYIAVFINNKWRMNANQSMFILNRMTPGKHKITLQLKKKDGSDYGLKKDIVVHIQ